MDSIDLTKDFIISSIHNVGPRLVLLGVRSIGIFVSFARQEGRQQSDIDILVEFEANKHNYDNFIETCFLLEELFGRKVELVTKDSLSPYLEPYILMEVEYVSLSA